jgi:hypothetical protein
MSKDSRHNILNDIVVLLLQGSNRGEDSFRKTGVISALIAETSLAPQDRTAQGPLSPVIGRLHPRYKGKGEQCRPQLQEIAAQGFGLGVSTGGSPAQQFSQTGAHRHQFPPHLGLSDFTILITVPDDKEPFDLSESPNSHRIGPRLPLGERLKISFQMRPADLTPHTVNHIIGAPAITVQNSRKSLTDKFPQGVAASRAGHQEHGHRSGYRHPQPVAFPLFLPTRFICMRHVGLGHRRLAFPVGDRQALGGFLTQTLDAAQADSYATQILQQFAHLPAALAKPAGENGHPCLQPGTKGASADLSRQFELYPDPARGKPTGNQTVLGNHRTKFLQFPDLMPLQGRNWSAHTRRQQTPAVGTGCRPMRHDLIHFLRQCQLPMIALVSRLTTGMTFTLFSAAFWSLGWDLGRSLRRIAGISIEPGLQLIDPLFQLSYSFQRLAQGILQKKDISLNFCRKFFPSLWSNRPLFHKTLDTPFWLKSLAPCAIFFNNFKIICPIQMGD